VNLDVILAKLGAVAQALQRIRKITGGRPDSIDDIDVQEIVILNLLRATQSCIDLAAHLIAVERLGLPDSLKAHFGLLSQAGIIDDELRRAMEAMVGFRNIAVHEYQRLDPQVIKDIVAGRLGDIDAYTAAVIAHLRAKDVIS
jgi:uncharacterized protein YutE (UPF0331/DUF86 family)